MSESESPSRPMSRRLNKPSTSPRDDRHRAKRKLGEASGRYNVVKVEEVGEDPTLIGQPADKSE